MRRPFPVLFLLVAVAIAAPSCGPSARDKALAHTLTAINAARDGFVAWDREHQATIAKTFGDTRAEVEAELARYRAARDPIETGFVLAYLALAAAAIDEDAPLPVVLVRLTELAATFENLKRSP